MSSFWSYSIALLAAACLFYLGWTQIEKPGTPFVDKSRTTLVVRPANSESGWDGAFVKDPDLSGPLGVRFVPSSAKEFVVRRASWGEARVDNASPGELRTLRLQPPPAKLDPRTENGDRIALSILPDKKDQPRSEGYIRIAPGRYKFLATAEGHIPKSIDVELAAGEVRKLTVDLEKLPKPPSMSAPVNPVKRPAPPLPRYQPPPRYQPAAGPRTRPQPQPQPRFTPVAPRPPVRPAPVFTPFP